MRSMVEGAAGNVGNSLDYALHVAQDFDGRNPEQSIPFACQVEVPALVMARPVASIVRLTINFDHQAAIADIEIDDVWPDRMLMTDSEPQLFAPNRVPQ